MRACHCFPPKHPPNSRLLLFMPYVKQYQSSVILRQENDCHGDQISPVGLPTLTQEVY